MTKTAKNKEVLDQLYQLVVKQASAPKPVATGVPGKDTNVESVSTEHDTVNQNAVGPENLKPQAHGQKPQTDASTPAKKKKAEEEAPTATEEVKKADAASGTNLSVEKLGKEIISLVQKFANNPVATGIPSHDPKWEAVSDKHDTVDQNAVKPETNPQGYHQKPAKDPAVPVAVAKAAEDEKVDTDKVASYELGKLWAEMVLKKAQDEQLEQVKEAGRRDFEALITQAAEQMKQAEKKQEKTAAVNSTYNANLSAVAEKRAEAEGVEAFNALYKQAQAEQVVAQLIEQNRQIVAKFAELENVQQVKEAEFKAQLAIKQAEIDKVAAEEREQQKFAALASHLETRIVERLQREVMGK